jgi:hypothetical protein
MSYFFSCFTVGCWTTSNTTWVLNCLISGISRHGVFFRNTKYRTSFYLIINHYFIVHVRSVE